MIKRPCGALIIFFSPAKQIGIYLLEKVGRNFSGSMWGGGELPITRATTSRLLQGPAIKSGTRGYHFQFAIAQHSGSHDCRPFRRSTRFPSGLHITAEMPNKYAFRVCAIAQLALVTHTHTHTGRLTVYNTRTNSPIVIVAAVREKAAFCERRQGGMHGWEYLHQLHGGSICGTKRARAPALPRIAVTRCS